MCLERICLAHINLHIPAVAELCWLLRAPWGVLMAAFKPCRHRRVLLRAGVWPHVHQPPWHLRVHLSQGVRPVWFHTLCRWVADTPQPLGHSKAPTDLLWDTQNVGSAPAHSCLCSGDFAFTPCVQKGPVTVRTNCFVLGSEGHNSMQFSHAEVIDFSEKSVEWDLKNRKLWMTLKITVLQVAVVHVRSSCDVGWNLADVAPLYTGQD